MISKQGIEKLLQSRLAGSVPPRKIEELLKEIETLESEWEEVNVAHRDMGYSLSVNCPDICWLADQIYNGAVIKLFRKKEATR